MGEATEMQGERAEIVLPEMGQVFQETLGWQPDTIQQAQFQRLYELVIAGNRQFNLTRITEPHEFWEKHLWDSLRGIKPWLEDDRPPTSLKVIDIGTGAGFPGIPSAIASPAWKVTLLDSVQKKTTFLKTVLTALELESSKALVGRAEEIGQQPQHREVYDLALIRAVATASVCAEYALPLVKVGGVAVLYRGQWTAEEAIALQRAVEQLGGILETTEAFSTPLSHAMRHCLYLKKVEPTPISYPRAIGVPAQKPL